MKNRDLIQRHLQNCLGDVKNLKFMVNRQSSVNDFIKVLNQLEEKIEELNSYIEREQLSPQEGFGLQK